MKKASYAIRGGFTLIELMVVISIIASLASVILIGVRAAQASGRDAARTSNSLQVRDALALYQNDHGGVPAGVTTSGMAITGCTKMTVNNVVSWDCKGDLQGTTANPGVLKPLVDGGYISHIPVDMINTNGLEYHYITADSTGVSGSIAITDSSSFGYVSERKSLDPVNDPVIVTVPVGTENYASYPETGYPADIFSSNRIKNLVISGPSTLTGGTQGTWTITLSNNGNKSITYTVVWDDALTDTLTSSNSSVNLNHTYIGTGTYNIHVTATYSNQSSQAATTIIITTPAHVPFMWSPDNNLGLCWENSTYTTTTPHNCHYTGSGTIQLTSQGYGASEYCAHYNSGDGRVWRLPQGTELISSLNSAFGGPGITATGLPSGFTQDKYYWGADSTATKATVAAWESGYGYAVQTPPSNYFDKAYMSGVFTLNTSATYVRCVSGEWGY